MLTHRQTTLLPSSGGSPSYGAGYFVNAYAVGAVANGASAASPVAVQAGHGFRVGDKFIVGTVTTTFRAVTAVAATSITYSGAAVAVADEDYLFNLGPDGGTTTPDFDGSPIPIWDEPSDAGTKETNSRVTADSVGMYQYWCKGKNWWELIRSDATTVASVVAGVGGSAGRYNVVDFGATGDGSTDDQDAIEACANAAVATDNAVYFPSGDYAVSTWNLSVASGTEAPAILGENASTTTITVTTDNEALHLTATGGSPNVIKGFRLENIQFRASTGVTNYLVRLDYLDSYWNTQNLRIDSNAQTIGTGLYLFDCQNGSIYNQTIKGTSGDKFTNGVLFETDDANQRGNIQFYGGLLWNCVNGAKFNTSTNSMNNCNFFGVKFVNSSAEASSIGAVVNGQADQTGFFNCHFEKYEIGIDNTSGDGMIVSGGLFSNCINAGSSDGSAIEISNADGCTILAPRINTCYDGVILDGTTTRVFYQKGRTASITNAEYTDSSSGTNTRLTGDTFDSDLEVSGTLKSTGGFGFDSNTTLTIATGAVTATKSFHQVDTESAAATDDLDTISGLEDGDILIIRAVNDARTVVAKDSVDNLKLAGDFTMDNSQDTLTLLKVGSNFLELSRSDNGA